MAVSSRPARVEDPVRDTAFKAHLVALIPQLRAFARTLTGDATAADDLAQDAMMKAWDARASFEMGTNMKAWTFMILRNQFYSEKRRSWRQTQLDQEAAERTLVAIDDPAAPVALDELRLGLGMLPAEQREALILVGAGGFAYEEAAEICGCAVGTVKSRVSRARRALQAILEGGHYDRDGRSAGEAMGSILAHAERLSGGAVTLFARAGGWRATPVRIRLALALIVALAPVLILSGVQSALAFRREAREHQVELASAAERSAATARARIAAAEVLLQTLAPGSLGFQCATRLAEIKDRIPGYDNLIRFDSIGRVACSAASVPSDPLRRDRPWFAGLGAGAPLSVTSQAGAVYADQPVLLASVPAEDDQGRFAGALTAVITLASLRPQTLDRSLPDQSDVAITDSSGRVLSTTSAAAFPAGIGAHLAGHARTASAMWFGPDRRGTRRVFSSAPLVGQEAYVVLSAPAQGVLSWARINPVSAVILPLLAFILPLLAVGYVTERGIVRWIAYLRRVASLYARGRYKVRPLRAEAAPPEIRELAETLDTMAQTIAARDAVVRESLAQKDDLLREIHHRVKNNLQIISSLLNLQQRALTDPAARAALSDTRQRIGALALIYRALYQGHDLRRVDLADFLDELIAQTIMGDAMGGAPIRTELDIDPLVIDADQLAPLALFAVEGITNAKKHGLDKAGGVLCVKFKVSGDDAELTITDSGVSGAKAAVGEGVGRTLMTAFARQLRGEVSFLSNPGGGLTARLVFPTPPART